MPDRHKSSKGHPDIPTLATHYLPYTAEGLPPDTIAVPRARSFLVVNKIPLVERDAPPPQLYIDGTYEFTAEDLGPSRHSLGRVGLMRVLAHTVTAEGVKGTIFGFVADLRYLRRGDITSGQVDPPGDGEPKWYNQRPVTINGYYQRNTASGVDVSDIYTGHHLFKDHADQLKTAMDTLHITGNLPEIVAQEKVVVVDGLTNVIALPPLVGPGAPDEGQEKQAEGF
jgi:hypothetical protein